MKHHSYNYSNNNSNNEDEKLDLNEAIKNVPEYKSLYNMSEIIKALSDPLRLNILYLLKDGELCACHIDSALNKPQSTIAHHLSILKKVNLLNWRKEGKWVYYNLANPEIMGLIEEITGERPIYEKITDNKIINEKITDNKIINEKITDKNNFKTRHDSKIKIEKHIDDEFFKSFEKKAKNSDIFKVGYTKIETKNINQEITHENVIILAIEMDENIIKTPPSERAKNLNKAFYDKFRKITENLSKHLEITGFKTQIAHPNEQLLDLPSLGQKAGLGYIGQNGLLITPEFGSKIKLSGILTSIDNPIFNKSNKAVDKYKWIKEQCKDCEECIESCESEALIITDKDIAELSKNKCIGSEEGCTYCIENCPFNEKGYDFVKKELLKKQIFK